MNRRAPILAAVGMVLLILIVVFLAILPKVREVGERREELKAAQQDEQFLLAELDRLRAARAQLPEVRRRLAKFNQKVPATADLPGMIRLVQNAADASNLEFFSIAPATPEVLGSALPAAPVASPSPAPSPVDTAPPPIVSTPDASIVPAEVVIIGGFFQVDQFLFRLETLPRAAKVISVSAGPGPNATEILGQLQVTLSVQFFTTDPNAGPGAALETAPPPAPAGTTPAPASPTPSTPATTVGAPTTAGG
ncbi:MAG: type 4a pilus biogenesis protein PilO [Actinobacteria bacterium]|nr:type 4a pilus biogenesis protein PilO [Actinomycetota bacterium]